MCFHSGLSLFGDDFLTVMSVVYTIFYVSSILIEFLLKDL